MAESYGGLDHRAGRGEVSIGELCDRSPRLRPTWRRCRDGPDRMNASALARAWQDSGSPLCELPRAIRGASHEATRVHRGSCRGGGMAARGAGLAARDAGYRISQRGVEVFDRDVTALAPLPAPEEVLVIYWPASCCVLRCYLECSTEHERQRTANARDFPAYLPFFLRNAMPRYALSRKMSERDRPNGGA